MPKRRPPFVFVHGAWHSATTWRLVMPLLEARGHMVRALDLPGAGANAKIPAAYERHPFDAAVFATEPSPNADTTQEERTRAVTELIEEVTQAAGAPAILVGHSLGGLTITAAAEAVPERVGAIVYLSAFLLPSGWTAHAMIRHPIMGPSLVPCLFLANPELIGALRINPRSGSADYRQQMRSTFYHDVSDADVKSALSHLHCDEPLGVLFSATAATVTRFGRVRRHYIRCLYDRAIPIAAQDFMLAEADEAIGGPTRVYTLAASHSPFYSQPQALVEVLGDIAFA